MSRYHESNRLKNRTAPELFLEFCRSKNLDKSKVAPLKKAYAKYSQWLNELRRKGSMKGPMSHQARQMNADMNRRAPAAQRWELVAKSLLAGYQNNTFRSVKTFGMRSDNYTLWGAHGQVVENGHVRDTLAVINSQSSLSRKGSAEPVDWVFALSFIFTAAPGAHLAAQQPPGFEQKLIVAVTARIEPEWIPYDVIRRVELFEGEAGGPAVRTFRGGAASVAAEELELMTSLRTVELDSTVAVLKVSEDNAEARSTKEENLASLMSMPQVRGGGIGATNTSINVPPVPDVWTSCYRFFSPSRDGGRTSTRWNGNAALATTRASSAPKDGRTS